MKDGIESRKDAFILIVDDTRENLQVLGNILRDNNYKIALANNGKEALNFVAKKLPDLILLDVMMPEIDGFEVCKRLKEDETTREVPVIFLTAKTEIEDIVRGFKVGGVDYITKPFNTDELLVRVKTHVELKQSRDIIMMQNIKLKELNQEKNNFLGIAAHDLKNPITAIKGFSKLMEDDDGSLTHDEIIDFSKEIRITSENMFQIVIDLLDINAIEEGKINLAIDDFNMDELVHNKIKHYEARAAEKEIKLIFKEELDNNIVSSDMTKIGQIFENLLSNAIKFSAFNKNIWINCIKSEYQNKPQIRVEVKDEGPGISPDDMKKLFGKFAKLTARPTNDESSTGLGLSIVKKLVEAMGGRIWCESELGHGAKFIFEFPEKV